MFDGQLDLDPLKLVFVDETAATTDMARRYGRRRRGRRLRCGVPHGHYKAITFVFGLRLRGAVALKAYDHAMNAATFEVWLEHCLLPTLEEGDIVVLDNLKAHKSPRVAEVLAEEKLHGRYLRLQPDFNPIEMAIQAKARCERRAHRAVIAYQGRVRLIEAEGIHKLREPYVKHLEGAVWEMRMKGRDGIARAAYVTASGQRVVVVRVFTKKTQKTPRREIETALKRAKEVR